MNKDRRQGYAAGLLTAAVILGLGGVALAAGRTIEIDDGISATVNGVPFTPGNEQGEEVPVFAYNGTTYAPIRAFSEAAGLTVDYDESTRTARVETSDYAAATDPQADSYITADRARELALQDAGVNAADARFLKARLDWEEGRAVYDVEFCAGATEYDYELDALTGAVLEKDLDCEDYDWSRHDDYHNRTAAQQSTTDGLISAEEAKAAALERLPGGTVRECELDFDDGRWEYELELRKDGIEYDCEIDAKTGVILKWERDD